jgi:hypothetical protein
MMLMRPMPIMCLLLALGLGGCGGGTDGDPREIAGKAREEAEAACQAKKPKAARQAADRAAAMRKKVEKDAEAAPASPDLQALAEDVRAAAREADEFADLAEEEQRLADKVGGFKASGYRLARKAAIKIMFAFTALVVDKAAADGYASLGPDQRNLVDCAVGMAGSPTLADGTPDWKAVGAKMSAFGDAPPPEIGLALAAGFLMAGQDDLALVEIQGVDLDGVTDPQWKLGAQVLRGLAYCLGGMPRLAVCEFEAAGEGPDTAPEFAAGVCLLRATMRGAEHDFRAADLEIMKAVKVWPNNPIATVLTGEVMVGEGQYEKAAVTLEDALREQGVDADPWLVAYVEKRARDIRDSKGDAEPLFCDAGFVRDMALHYVWQAAKTSEPARGLQGYLDRAKAFGAEYLNRVPGMAAREAP